MRPSIINEVDTTFWIITGISIILLLIITVAMLYFIFKYSRKRNPVPSNIEGNTTIEIIWTVVPIIIVLYLFFISWNGFINMRDVPKDAMVVKVTGQMWKWTFEYDNGKKSDTVNLPHNKNIKFELSSNDVLHSFYLPHFRVKEDVVPGSPNYIWIRTDDLGTYYAACAEYCGLNHSYMYAPVNVISEDQFEIWKNILPVETKMDSTAAIKDSLSSSGTTGNSDSTGTLNDSTKKVNGTDTAKTKVKSDTSKKETPASDLKKTEEKDTTKNKY
ncbi:MAG TPA: cytochrome c oxidase subunit II [Ignavibacteria bacterium]|nr:cytochrome c oxidase subunit II [Ignavibacteria bacterium]